MGLGGLEGSRRTELVKSLFGVIPIDEVEIFLDGEKIEIDSARIAISHGFFYLSEEREVEGLFHHLSICQNIMSAGI